MRGASRGPDDGRLGNRGVDDSLGAEFRVQPLRNLERATINADVLAETEHVLVAIHFLEKSFANRLEVGDLRHRGCPSSPGVRAPSPPT